MPADAAMKQSDAGWAERGTPVAHVRDGDPDSEAHHFAPNTEVVGFAFAQPTLRLVS